MGRDQLTDYRGVGPVADVFSTGATLYFMLTGRLVRPGLERCGKNQWAMISVILNEPVVPVRTVKPSAPRGIAEVIDRAITDDTASRYQDAGQMLKALQKAARK